MRLPEYLSFKIGRQTRGGGEKEGGVELKNRKGYRWKTIDVTAVP